MKTIVGLILGVALLVGGGAAQAFDEKHVKKLKAAQGANLLGTGVWCEGCDLSEAVLEGAKLRKANLEGANFEKAILRRADLSEANLTKANLSGANLGGAELMEANLTNANLSGAQLYGAILWEANLTGADLTDAKNLKKAELDGAILCKTKMPWGEDNSGCK